MKLVADEGVDRQIVDGLRADGHEVEYGAEMDPGVSDDLVLARCNAVAAPLVTADKDFGELVFRQRRVTHGVVLIRLPGLSLESKAAIVSAAIKVHERDIPGAFAVIGPASVRIRRLPS